MTMLTRRPFLKLLLPAAFVTGVGISLGAAVAWPYRNRIYSRYIRHVPERANGALSEEEMRYAMALAEVIYPTSDDAQKRLLHDVVIGWVRGRKEEDGYWRYIARAWRHFAARRVIQSSMN